MKVLWVIKGLGAGGAERLLVSLADARDHETVDITVAYLLADRAALVPALEAVGVRVVCLHGGGADPRWLVRLRRLARGFDVVHFHSPLVAGLGRPFLRMPHRPAIVTTEHLPWPSYHPVTRALDRATAGLDDARFAVSEAVRASMPSGPARRTQVLHQGVDVEAIRAAADDARDAMREELGVTEEEFVLVTVANYRAQKDYPNLFAAYRMLLDRGMPVRLVCVGQGPEQADVERALAASGAGERTIMLGPRSDVPRVLAAADLFVLASKDEGLPIALLEAFAAGLPAVATAVGGTVEALRDGREGVLVPPSDPGALAAAVERLLDDPATRGAMAAAASERADDFDIRAAMRSTVARYEAVRRMLR